MDSKLDPVLIRFRAALGEIYGARLARVVLFGSRTRGDGGPNADYDVAVFLNAMPDVWRERRRLADLRVEFLDDSGAFFDAKPYDIHAMSDPTPSMHEIRRHGLDL